MLRGQQQASNVASFRSMAEHVIHEPSSQCENNTQRKAGKLNFSIKCCKKSLLTVNSKNKTTETCYGQDALGETNTL
jgi:hypothetical protein